LSSLAARLRGELPSPELADPRALAGGRIETNPGGNASPNGDALRRANAGSEHRTVGLATADRSAAVTAAVSPISQRTVVALNEIRLGAPPPDAALVVVLPRFAPHSALDQAADLGVTADWPILGVIGIRRRPWLARLNDRYAGLSSASAPDAAAGDPTQTRDTEAPDTARHEAAPDDMHHGGDDD
jgi:hypothetical protein